MLRRAFLPLAVCTTFIVLALTCCGGSSFDSGVMASELTERLLPEEQHVQDICGSLDGDAEKLKTLSQARKSKEVADTLRAEITTNLEALFKSIGVAEGKCKAGTILNEAVAGTKPSAESSSCAHAIDVAIGNATESGATTRKEIAGASHVVLALKDAGVRTGNDILANPIQAARLVDLSAAVVSATLSLADSAQRLAEELAESIPVAKGVVRIALDELTAELVAWTFDKILDALETEHIVHPASVARKACQLDESGVPRSMVATRVLKRAILRFKPGGWSTIANVPQDAGTPPSYPMADLCARFESESVCSDLRKKLSAGGDSDEEKARPLEPTLASAHDWSHASESDANVTSQHLLDAAVVCDGLDKVKALSSADGGAVDADAGSLTEGRCTMAMLGEIAGVLAVYKLDAKANHDAVEKHLEAIDRSLEKIDTKVNDLSITVEDLRDRLDTANAALAIATEKSRAQLELENGMLQDFFKCDRERSRARSARADVVEDLFWSNPALVDASKVPDGATKALLADAKARQASLQAFADGGVVELARNLDELCRRPSSDRLESRLEGNDAVTLSVAIGEICDVSDTRLQIEVETAKGFGSCALSLDPNAMTGVLALFDGLAKHGLTDVVLTGHADQNLRKSPEKCAYDNHELSVQRAVHVKNKVLDDVQLAKVLTIETKGDGAYSKDCSKLGTGKRDCDAENRRITIEIVNHGDRAFNPYLCSSISGQVTKADAGLPAVSIEAGVETREPNPKHK